MKSTSILKLLEGSCSTNFITICLKPILAGLRIQVLHVKGRDYTGI